MGKQGVEYLFRLVKSIFTLVFQQTLLFLSICDIPLYVHERQLSYCVDSSNHLAKPLGEHGLGQTPLFSQSSTLPLIKVPTHDVLPLLEQAHLLELAEERNVPQDEVVDTPSDELFVRHEVGEGVAVLADSYETRSRKDHHACVVSWRVGHLFVHVA